MGLPLQSLSSIHLLRTGPALYRNKPHKDLKKTKLCIGPILTRLEAFLGFLVKTKMKAYTKLTIAMCCQIFTRRSLAAISACDRRRGRPLDKIRNLKEKTFSRMLLDPFRLPRPDVGTRPTEGIFNI